MEANTNKSFLEKTLGIEFITCESSNIEAFAFDKSKGDIWVLFKRDLVYKYPGQTPDKYLELCNADSKGKWVNDNLVKPKVDCQRYRIHPKGNID